MTTSDPQNNESIGAALVRSTWHAGLSDIAADAADIALDQLLDDGVFRDMPVVGWLAKGRTTIRAVRDALLLKKIIRFLQGAAAASPGERESFRRKLEADPEEARRVGEQLLLLLDRHEHFDKSFCTERLYAAYVAGRITYHVFQRLTASIDRLDAAHLKTLPEVYASLDTVTDDVGQALLVAGLVDVYVTLHDLRLVEAPKPAGSAKLNYKSNDLGRQMIAIIRGHTA